MKISQIYGILCAISLIGCQDKSIKEDTKIHNPQHLNANFISTYLENHDLHTSIIGKGYNSVDKTIKNNCLDNTYYEFIPSGKSEINFFNDLNIDELNEKLDININGKLHSPQGDISLDTNFLKLLNTNQSSATVTLIANITNGKNKLKRENTHSPGFRIHDFYTSIFTKNRAEFIKVCGDEIIESQRLSAYLIITARIDFKNKAAKESYEAKVGGDKNIFEEIGLNGGGSFSNLDENTRKSIKITIAGTQLGGDFKQLQSILKKNVCNLNQFEQCNQMFETINTYFSSTFMNQLDTKNQNSWIISEIKSIPYSKLIILNDNLEYFSDQFNYGLDYAKFSNKLSNIKDTNLEIYKNIKKIMKHDNSKYFSNDEKNYLENQLDNSQNNINIVDEFFSECDAQIGLKECIKKHQTYLDTHYSPVDPELKTAKINKHIATYNTGIETFEINNHIFYKKDLEQGIFKDTAKLSFTLTDSIGNEINDDSIEIVCQQDYKSKLRKVNPGIWISALITNIPTFYTLIEKATNAEYTVLDFIWNGKESDLTNRYIKDHCGKNGSVFFVTGMDSPIKKVAIWEVAE